MEDKLVLLARSALKILPVALCIDFLTQDGNIRSRILSPQSKESLAIALALQDGGTDRLPKLKVKATEHSSL